MIPPPSKLRELCQKPNYRNVGNWMARYITRDMAIYVTWLVLHTRWRADTIALISLLCGLTSALLISMLSAAAFLTGAILLQCWYLLDHVDGQVARYYQEADLTGTFLDFMIHFFVHSSVTFGLGVRMFLVTGKTVWLCMGFLAALAMGGLSQFNDCKYKAFFARLAQWQGKMVQMRPQEAAKNVTPTAGTKSRLKQGFIFLYKLTEIHVFMNLLGLAALAELLGWSGAKVFTWVYAVLLPCVLIVRLVHTIRTHGIDADFASRFSLIDSE